MMDSVKLISLLIIAGSALVVHTRTLDTYKTRLTPDQLRTMLENAHGRARTLPEILLKAIMVRRGMEMRDDSSSEEDGSYIDQSETARQTDQLDTKDAIGRLPTVQKKICENKRIEQVDTDNGIRPKIETVQELADDTAALIQKIRALLQETRK